MVQTQILSKYGQPDATYLAKWVMMWEVRKDFPWFPVARFEVNKDFQIKLTQAFFQLQKAGLHTEIKTFDGCLNNRTVRGMQATSLHAWALAIDLNASVESLGQTSTHWSGRFIAIMKAAGLYWGGDWIHRKDNMHFAYLNG